MSIYTTPAPKRARRRSPGVRVNVDVLRAEFGKRLWTVRDAARVTGLHQTTIYDLMKGETGAPSTIKRILQALEENPPTDAANSLLA